jgi:ParB family chromosome partitioning protein
LSTSDIRAIRPVASRLKLTDLVPAAVDAFYADQIGVGYALLLAKLPADQQEAALSARFKEVYNGASKPARILLPVRSLKFWIASNILLAAGLAEVIRNAVRRPDQLG